LNKVKKLVALREKYFEAKTDEEKNKILKQMTKIEQSFLLYDKIGIGKDVCELILLHNGKRVIVENNKITYSKRHYITEYKHIHSYLLAFGVMLLLFFVSGMLNAFGILNDRIFNSFSLVLSVGAVVLSVWTLYDCYKIKEKMWIVYVFNGFALFLNLYNVYNDLQYFIG
jgi:hypothetical protein